MGGRDCTSQMGIPVQRVGEGDCYDNNAMGLESGGRWDLLGGSRCDKNWLRTVVCTTCEVSDKRLKMKSFNE